MEAFYLTDADRQALQEMLVQWRRMRGNIPLRSGDDVGHQAPEIYVAKPQESSGIPAMTPAAGTATFDEPGEALCDIYQIVVTAGVPEIQPTGLEKTVYNVSTTAIDQVLVVVKRDKYGRWLAEAPGTGGSELVECCLAEDHPGRGVVFDVNVGTWNSATHGWDYTGTGTEKAIDWRYGVPYPSGHPRGLFVPRASAEYGTIYECVSLDCEDPGDECVSTLGTGS